MRLSFFCALLSVLFFSACKHKMSGIGDTNPILNSPNIKPLTEAIRADTAKAENWYKRGLALHRMKEDSLALNDWYRAAAIDTNNAAYASAIGDLLFEHKDVNTATTWLMRALHHNPNDQKAHLKFAKLMLFTKDYGKAFSEINTVLRQDAYNPEGYFLKGLVYKDMKDTNKAISSFQTVLDVAPDYREAAIQLGQLYTQRGDALGLQYYENAFKMDTTDVFPLYARGMYYQNKKEYEAAKTEYARCIAHDMQYANAY